MLFDLTGPRLRVVQSNALKFGRFSYVIWMSCSSACILEYIAESRTPWAERDKFGLGELSSSIS